MYGGIFRGLNLFRLYKYLDSEKFSLPFKKLFQECEQVIRAHVW